jgi:hypothetical protein
MEGLLTPSEIEAFLRDLSAALEGFVEGMARYLASTPLPGRHPPLALEHGIAVHQASLTWARAAKAKLAQTPPPAMRQSPQPAARP